VIKLYTIIIYYILLLYIIYYYYYYIIIIYSIGDFGFDPLNLYELKGSSPKSKKHMRLMEINNGRIAMMAILSYSISEFYYNQPITVVTPIFFTPFWFTLPIDFFWKFTN